MRAEPAGELRAAEAALDAAEARGDQQAIDEANAELDRLFGEARARTEDARREQASQASATARFSSGVRRPLKRELSASQRMDAVLLERSGREPVRRRI